MAISLTASDNHIYGALNGSLSSTVPFSISIWMKTNWNVGTRVSLCGIYNGIPSTGLPTAGLQIGSSTGAGDISCWKYGGEMLFTSTANTMTAYNNRWVLVTFTTNGTTNKLYRNHQLLLESTVAQQTVAYTQLYINGYPPSGNASETANYGIDSLMIYNRVLQLDEIVTMYYAEGFRHNIQYGLLSRYEFDEYGEGTSISVIKDLSTGAYPLQVVGVSGNYPTYSYTDSFSNSNMRPVIT